MRCLILLILIFQTYLGFSQTSEDVVEVTSTFLETLKPDELESVQYKFGDSLRTKWTNLPVGMAQRPGIKYGDLSEESKIKFHNILTTVFSSQGYLKTTSIMNLDDILNVLYEESFKRELISEEVLKEIRNLNWSYDNYFISIWGKPNMEKAWGLKFEGHHISINLSVIGNNYSVTPLFLGTDPRVVSIEKYAGLRVLSKEEDYGLLLINSLQREQKAIATLSQEVPGDIITNPSSSQRITEYQGLKASTLTDKQKHILEILIKEYVNNLDFEKAQEYLGKILKSGIDEIYFAWIGSYEHAKPSYYIINGPDFIIEFDNRNGDHIHTIWREKGNDFGEDLLKTHYLNHKH
jgi:hypothetical protein